MTSRVELIRHPFTPSMRLLEIGPSYNPIIPKGEGWRTTVIDHATQAALQEKYQATTAANIEPVDYVWQGEPLDQLVPAELHGQFDGLIASHVGEHIPDLVGFLNAADRLLTPSGIIALALPDKRVCFDFFQPHTTTGELLEAYRQRRQRHRLSKIFDVAAYSSHRGDGVWLLGQTGEFHLDNSLAAAYAAFNAASDQSTDPYTDTHGWQFTPASFQLNILELYQLGVIPWTISRIESAPGIEFYIWLERRAIRLSDQVIETKRLELLRQTVIETSTEQLAQFRSGPTQGPTIQAEVIQKQLSSTPSITAIIPLYNGARFIERALDSVVKQTLPPLEIIVINDGSTDNGAEVVKAFQTEHSAANIILLERANGGQSAARNMGAAQARGSLLAFLDQDDVWYAAHLERLVRPFVRPPAGQPLGWVYSDLDEADRDGQIIHHNFLTTVQTASGHPKRNLYTCIDRDMFVLPSASLISKAVFDAVGGYDERLSGYEDDDLFARIFHAGYQNIFVRESLSKWCIHEGSSSYTPRMRKSRMIYCRKLLEKFPDKPDKHIFYASDTILPRFYRHAQAELYHALKAGDLDQIAETQKDLLFLLKVGAEANGINTFVTKREALHRHRLLRRISARAALRAYRSRRLVDPLARWIPHKVWSRAAKMLPVYG